MWLWVPSRSFLWPNVPLPVVLMAVWCTPGCRHRVGAPHRRGSLPLVLKAVCTPSLVVVAMGASTLVLVWCSTRPCGRWCPPARPRGALHGRWWPSIIVVAVSWPCGASLAVLAVCCPLRSLWLCCVPRWSSWSCGAPPGCRRGRVVPRLPSWPLVPPHSLILVVPCSAVGGPRSSWCPPGRPGCVLPTLVVVAASWCPAWLFVPPSHRGGHVVAVSSPPLVLLVVWCPPPDHRGGRVVPPGSSL